MAQATVVRVKYEIEPGPCMVPGCTTPAIFENWEAPYTNWWICHRHAVEHGYPDDKLHLIGHEMTLDELTMTDPPPEQPPR